MPLGFEEKSVATEGRESVLPNSILLSLESDPFSKPYLISTNPDELFVTNENRNEKELFFTVTR